MKGLLTIFISAMVSLPSLAYQPPTDEDLKKRNEQSAEEDKRLAKNPPGQKKDPAAALNEPGMDQKTIPSRPDLILPFSKPPLTAEERELRLRILNALWSTPLGQTLRHYLLDVQDPMEIPVMAHQMVVRMFNDGTQVATRIMAIHVLAADLYSRQLLSDEVEKRIGLLIREIERQREAGQAKFKSELISTAVGFLLLSIPFGSPVVREESYKILKNARAGLYRLFGARAAFAKKMALGRVLTKEAWKSYDVGKAWTYFFTLWGGYSTAYIAYNEWLGALLNQQTSDVNLLNGLDLLLNSMQM